MGRRENVMKTYRWRWHFESGGRGRQRPSAKDRAGNQTPVAGLEDLPLPLRLPMPIESGGDKVAQASWESFPASDAPTWRGR
jgi:hypothetical protein